MNLMKWKLFLLFFFCNRRCSVLIKRIIFALTVQKWFWQLETFPSFFWSVMPGTKSSCRKSRDFAEKTLSKLKSCWMTEELQIEASWRGGGGGADRSGALTGTRGRGFPGPRSWTPPPCRSPPSPQGTRCCLAAWWRRDSAGRCSL